MMESKEKKPKGKPSNKKTLLLIGGVAGIVIVIIVILVVILGSSNTNRDTNQGDYKIVDLTNKPITEACSIAKTNGWKVVEPIEGKYSSDTQIDCENTYADVESYKYNETAHEVKIKWRYHRLTEDEYKGKTIPEICELGKQYQLTVDPTSSFGSAVENTEYIHNCDDNRVPDSVVQDGRILHFAFVKDSGASSGSSSSSSSSSGNSTSNSSTGNSSNSSSSTNNNSSTSGSSSSTDTNFRKIMADYESFMNKYVDFMKKYKNASSADAMSMLSEYSSMMQDYAKFADSIKGYNQSNLSASDWAYYLEVTARVTKKLSEIQ